MMIDNVPSVVFLFWTKVAVAALLSFWVLRWVNRKRRIAGIKRGQEYNIIHLWKRRLVLPRATGQTITSINAEIHNRTGKRVDVIIPVGTYFIASSRHQNMVTSQPYRFQLQEHATTRISVQAACMNANRPIPGERDRFKGVARAPTKIVKFLVHARSYDPMTIQAGVWAISDRYTKREVQARLITSAGAPAISDKQAATAKVLLDQLQIRNRL